VNTLRHRIFISLLVAVGVVLVGCSHEAADLPRNSQTVGGMTIEVGVLPAELIQGHLTAPGEPKALHGGTPPYSKSHHLVVALFDAKTGARITDARIRAGVGNRSYNHEPDKTLEPMEMNGAMSYGNFFLLQGEGVWHIHLEILRAGATRAVQADFAYEHPSD
jgi:hypothetical protein